MRNVYKSVAESNRFKIFYKKLGFFLKNANLLLYCRVGWPLLECTWFSGRYANRPVCEGGMVCTFLEIRFDNFFHLLIISILRKSLVGLKKVRQNVDFQPFSTILAKNGWNFQKFKKVVFSTWFGRLVGIYGCWTRKQNRLCDIFNFLAVSDRFGLFLAIFSKQWLTLSFIKEMLIKIRFSTPKLLMVDISEIVLVIFKILWSLAKYS